MSTTPQLSSQTSIFNLPLWAVLGFILGSAFVLLLFLISLCFISKKPKPTNPPQEPAPDPLQESGPFEKQALLKEDDVRIQVEMGKGLHRVKFGGLTNDGVVTARPSRNNVVVVVGPGVSHLGWGHWYTLRELEEWTNGFADENVIGQGGYGIVYRGVKEDGNLVAVKNLLNNRGQAEKEFEVEVEAIGRVKHKNLVRLLGYCAEGAHRILVYEFVNNGNLEQWLHGDVGPSSPLTWEARMNIILGTAKGLKYLHEGLEPKVIHRDIKSSNILLDKHWNPKLSDFGLAKLIDSDMSFIATRVMGTYGYVAPEYASTGMLNDKSDIYSFGILMMEIISGRNPVDKTRPQEEVYLVDWLKKMVSNGNSEGVLDPKLPEKPSSKVLKRALFVAIRCVDPNSQKRPKIGYIINMLEAEDQSSLNDRKAGRIPWVAHQESPQNGSFEKLVTQSNDYCGSEAGVKADEAR